MKKTGHLPAPGISLSRHFFRPFREDSRFLKSSSIRFFQRFPAYVRPEIVGNRYSNILFGDEMPGDIGIEFFQEILRDQMILMK